MIRSFPSKVLFVAGVSVLGLTYAVANPFAQTPAAVTAESLFGQLRWRNIGPANMAGRVICR